jgi:hypothetical protein
MGLYRKLQHINIHYGYGDIKSCKMLTKTTGIVKIIRPHVVDTTRKFRLSDDLKKVTFCGQTREIIRISCWDDGGKTLDRYTVVFLDQPSNSRNYSALAMSSNPFHAQGFGQHTWSMIGPHLGKKIKFEQLPYNCQICVKRDLEIEAI